MPILKQVQLSGVRNMKNKLSLSLILIVILCISLLILVLVRTFIPIVILPKFNASNITIVSLIALVINYYLNDEEHELISIIFAVVAFGVLPYVSGFVTIIDALLLAVKGGLIFTVLMFLFLSIVNRLSTNDKNKFAPIISAFLLFLAIQCLLGII